MENKDKKELIRKANDENASMTESEMNALNEFFDREYFQKQRYHIFKSRPNMSIFYQNKLIQNCLNFATLFYIDMPSQQSS